MSVPQAFNLASTVFAGMRQVSAVERHFARRGQGEEFAMEARWIARRIPASAKKVLDLGCGIGALFPWIGPSRTIGLDHVHCGLVQTRQKHPATRLGCGDCAQLPFASQSFDIITAQHLIEHLEKADSGCADWRRVLRTGGLLLLVTPNAGFVDPRVFDDPTHRKLYHVSELIGLLERNGFEVLETCTLGLPWFRKICTAAGGWRLRRGVLRHAEMLSRLPGLRNLGQSLCCLARKRTT